MFKEILEHIEKEGRLCTTSLTMINELCQFWTKESSNVLNSLKVINKKYQFENLIKIRSSNSFETHLQYWKDVSQFGLSPAIEDHDIDMDYILFVKDFFTHSKFSNYVEPKDIELDYYFDSIDRLFYSWFSFLWQNSNGASTGIPTCTIENNSSIMFYFNDFLWDDFSDYHKIRENKRVDGSLFNRELSITEIYARTNRNFKWNDKEIIWEFNRFNEIITMSILNNKTTYQKNTTKKQIEHKADKGYKNSNEVAAKYFIKESNVLINNGWKLREKKSG